MRAAAFTSITIAILISGAANAACVKPEIPACAVEKGAFPNSAIFDQCRIQMLAYKDGMEQHATCTKEAGAPHEGQASEQELQATLTRFNQRARGE